MIIEINPILFSVVWVIFIIISCFFVSILFKGGSSKYSYVDSVANDVRQISESLVECASRNLTLIDFTSTLQSQLRLCSNRISELHRQEALLKELISSVNFYEPKRLSSLTNELLAVKAKIKKEVSWRKILKTQYLHLLFLEKPENNMYF